MIAKKTAALCAALALTAVLGVFPGHAAVLAASEKDDFYQAVNEKTLAEKQIKPTEASWSWFHERNLENKEFLTGEIEDIASHQGTYDKGTPEQKIADLYQCITDQKTRNATARKHIQDVLAPIKAARTPQELTAAVGELHQTYGIDVLMRTNSVFPTAGAMWHALSPMIPSCHGMTWKRNPSRAHGNAIQTIYPGCSRKTGRPKTKPIRWLRPSWPMKNPWRRIC